MRQPAEKTHQVHLFRRTINKAAIQPGWIPIIPSLSSVFIVSGEVNPKFIVHKNINHLSRIFNHQLTVKCELFWSCRSATTPGEQISLSSVCHHHQSWDLWHWLSHLFLQVWILHQWQMILFSVSLPSKPEGALQGADFLCPSQFATAGKTDKMQHLGLYNMPMPSFRPQCKRSFTRKATSYLEEGSGRRRWEEMRTFRPWSVLKWAKMHSGRNCQAAGKGVTRAKWGQMVFHFVPAGGRRTFLTPAAIPLFLALQCEVLGQRCQESPPIVRGAFYRGQLGILSGSMWHWRGVGILIPAKKPTWPRPFHYHV